MDLYSIVKLLSILAHTGLGLYSLLKNPRHRLNQVFSLAVFSIAVMEFGYFMLLVGSDRLIWIWTALTGQCLASASIVLLSLIYGRDNYRDSLKRGRFYLIAIYLAALALPITALSGTLKFALSDEYAGYSLVFDRIGSLLIGFLFMCILLALINMENTYRQVGQGRRRIRYPAIVFIGTLAFHLLIYSLGLGFSYIRIDVLAVASITLMAANICLAYPVIRPQPAGPRIYVSRSVIARSYTLLLAGVYLLVIGMLGKIVQIIGKNLSFFLAFLIAFFVILVIVVAILSRSLKQRVQLFLERNFYRSKYDYRREWEKFSRRVSSIFSIKDLLQEVLGAVSETVGTGNVSIMLLDERRREFRILLHGEQDDLPSIPAQDEFLDWLWRYGKPARIEGTRLKATGTFGESPHIPLALLEMISSNTQDTEAKGILVPIIAKRELTAIMTLGKRDTSPYSQEDLDLLETMANQISIAVMNAKTSQELAISRELESFHKLSTMLLHDLKSSASMLSLVIQNAADNFDNPEFQRDALSAMSNVVKRIQRLIRRFSAAPREMEFQPNLKLADLNDIANRAIAGSGIRDLTRVKLVQEFNPTLNVMADPENLERVILNLIQNSIEAIDSEGVITVKTARSSDGYAQVSVADTGCGMSQEFIRGRLFQPFQTTKEKGWGIGLYQCAAIVDALDGLIEVQSEKGVGSTFTVKLPIRTDGENAQSGTSATLISGSGEVKR